MVGSLAFGICYQVLGGQGQMLTTPVVEEALPAFIRNLKMRSLCLALLVIPVASESAFGDWPAFLGGASRSAAIESVRIPEKWSPDSGVKWKTPLVGHGQSSPVVVGQNIYVTAIDGPMKETNLVSCFDLATGEKKWSKEFANSLQVKNDPYTSRAAPTPTADTDGVYAFFESGDLVSYTPDGTFRWERKLMDDYGKYEGRFGLGGSVAQDAKHIFILADNSGPSYLIAIEKATGKTVWKSDRTSRTAWSSPMMLQVAGEQQIVVSSAGSVDGYDPKSGKLLWTISDVGGNTVASPVPFGDGKFLVGASPGRNGENSEGARKSNMAVQVTKSGDSFAANVLWRNKRATSSFGSPIVYKDRAYYSNRSGGVFCIDANTGETIYEKRIAESTWATPVGNADRVFFFGQTGDTTVVGASGEFKKLSVNRLYEESKDGGGPGGFNAEIQYGVALCTSGLIVRTGSNLYLVPGE